MRQQAIEKVQVALAIEDHHRDFVGALYWSDAPLQVLGVYQGRRPDVPSGALEVPRAAALLKLRPSLASAIRPIAPGVSHATGRGADFLARFETPRCSAIAFGM